MMLDIEFDPLGFLPSYECTVLVAPPPPGWRRVSLGFPRVATDGCNSSAFFRDDAGWGMDWIGGYDRQPSALLLEPTLLSSIHELARRRREWLRDLRKYRQPE